jgi:membrane-bound lytic murein transglycosylase D
MKKEVDRVVVKESLMKNKVTGLRVIVMHTVVLAGFSLMQGCTTGDCPVRWLNWPYGTPKDQPVILPAGPEISDAGLLPAYTPLPDVSPMMPPVSLPPAVPSSTVHRVVKGETLASIASSYGTSWKSLADYNNLSNPNLLKVGQEIRIPDSLGAASVKQSRPVSSRPSSSRPVSSSIKQGATYTIQKGDYLSSIAKRSGLTVNEIKMANSLKSDNIIAGKKLSIPKKGEVKAPAVAKAIPAKAANPAPAPAPAVTDASLPPPAPLAEMAAPAANVSSDADLAVPAAPSVAAPSAPVYEHVLYPGETLDDVARQYGSSQQEIMKLNNITDPASVKPGTKLLVPILE